MFPIGYALVAQDPLQAALGLTVAAVVALQACAAPPCPPGHGSLAEVSTLYLPSPPITTLSIEKPGYLRISIGKPNIIIGNSI